MMRRRGAGGQDPGASVSQSSGIVPSKVAATLKKFDVYPKLETDYEVKSSAGATVSIIAGILIFLLVVSEFSSYMTVTIKDHVVVDHTIGTKVQINFNISFYALHCGEVNLDAMDVAGDQQNDIDHDIFKMRLDGNQVIIGDAFRHDMDQDPADPLPADYCGSCYGAGDEGECCNTCDALKQAYVAKGWNANSVSKTSEQCQREEKHPVTLSQPGEGCMIYGTMLVNKVAGNFHVALGDSAARGGAHIHQFNPTKMHLFNTTHRVNSLSFGQPYPGMEPNPLDGEQRSVQTGYGTFQYYLKIIPTTFTGNSGEVISTNQYSVTDQYQAGIVNGRRQNVLPGVFFVYDFAPFLVQVNEHYVSFAHFLTRLCAIAGGVFTVAGIIFSFTHHCHKALRARMAQ